MANSIGALGEELAVRYMQSKGHAVLSRNYWKKWGEIDVVTRSQDGKVHFCEVKSVSCESVLELSNVSVRPEDNVHASKREKLGRVIQSYIAEYSVDEWTFDVVSIYIDSRTKAARVVHLSDVVL
jgi:putative endonuclease